MKSSGETRGATPRQVLLVAADVAKEVLSSVVGLRERFVLVKIEEVSEVDEELVEAFRLLTPQLSSSNPAPSREDLVGLVESGVSHLLVAVDPNRPKGDAGRILGSLTLVVFRIPTGLRAWIEDVVVDEAARGKGVAYALNEHALALARQLGAVTVDLTSRPSRQVANRLYQRLGFVARDTNVYRFDLNTLT